MTYCGKCGSELKEGLKFCTSCGTAISVNGEQPKVSEQTNTSTQSNTTGVPPTSNQNSDFSSKMKDLNNTPDCTEEFTKEDIEQNKILGILAYLGILVLIPILAGKGSKYARFHANQGLVLLIAEIAYSIAYGILSSILFMISFSLSIIVSLLGLVSFVFLVLAIIGIINVVNSKAKELPIIGKFKILK